MPSSYDEKNDYANKDLGYSYAGSSSEIDNGFGSDIDFNYAYWAIKSHLRLFLIIMLIVISIGSLLTARKILYYKTVCRIILSPEKKIFSGFESLYESNELDYLERRTEIMRIISSYNIQKVAEQSSLNKNADFKKRKIEHKIASIKGSFTAVEVFDTHLIDIACEWNDPKIAQEHANLLALIYLNDYKERTSGVSTLGLKRLKAEEQELLADYEKKSIALHSFEAQNNLISIDKDKNSLAILRLSALMDYQIETEHEKIGLEVDLNHLKIAQREGNLTFDTNIIKDPKILKIKEDIQSEEKRLLQYKKTKGEKNIDVMNQRSLIASLRKSLRKMMDEHIFIVQSDFNKHAQREELLAKSLAESKEEYNSNVVEYQRLKNQLSIVEDALHKVSLRVQEIEIANTLKKDTAAMGIYSRATLPTRPSKPNKMKEFSFSLLLAVVMASAICLLMELLDKTLRSKTEIEKSLGLQVISYIPKFPDNKDELPVINNPNSIVSEAFRALRTTLLLSKSKFKGKVIMFTSASPSEGKTCFSANMALCMQQQGKKVLLLEADFRKSRLEDIFEADVQKGLSNFLLAKDDADFSESIKTVSNGLDILFAGPTPFNPTELLQSDKFTQFIDDVVKRYDYVFISATPAATLSDSRIIASNPNVMTIFLVRAYSTNGKIASASVKDLQTIGAHFGGVVVNGVDVPMKSMDSYSEYTFYYGQYSDSDSKDM
ncbi:MAG: hypothetical protein COA79_15800 [Planctomycetota bacterium]|nr:MAG: hypothetical protein COA79_15800 [Planctomycetota bacterium]